MFNNRASRAVARAPPRWRATLVRDALATIAGSRDPGWSGMPPTVRIHIGWADLGREVGCLFALPRLIVSDAG